MNTYRNANKTVFSCNIQFYLVFRIFRGLESNIIFIEISLDNPIACYQRWLHKKGSVARNF